MLLYAFITSFFATLGFALLFRCRKESLLLISLGGAVGWTFYKYFTSIGMSTYIANFIASCVIGLLGEIYARIERQPVTVYIIPGIIPLVPGYGVLLTMEKLLQNHTAEALGVGLKTLGESGSIAMGIVVVSSLVKMQKQYRFQKANDISLRDMK